MVISTLLIEESGYFETLARFYVTVRRHMPQDHNLDVEKNVK
jgi:hypothetical protein